MTVDERLRQAGTGAADAHAVVFVEAACAAGCRADGYAGKPLYGVGDILVGQLTDVFRGDHFDHGIRIALDLQRALERLAVCPPRLSIRAEQVEAWRPARASWPARG